MVSPSSNDSSYSPTTMDEKNNNLVSKPNQKRTSSLKKEHEVDENIKTERPIGKTNCDIFYQNILLFLF